jgi:catechol 2,3-dioxygenase-like lactoylglutathione lyase family enzyme
LCFLSEDFEESAVPVIPVLSVPDPDAASQILTGVFGFVPEGGLLRLGDQAVAVVAGPALGHGCIDHLALAVPDLAIAARAMEDRGARPDPEVTPDGPVEIAEFWGGVRYLFLQGPGGARFEFIETPSAPHGPGHDHIGIPCSDIAASAAFLSSQGATPRAAFTLHRPDGITEVRFLALQGALLELYQPPRPAVPATQGPWRRLRITGARPATGPDGLTIAPA